MSAVWAAGRGFWKEREGLDQQAEARTPCQYTQVSSRTGTPATRLGGGEPPNTGGLNENSQPHLLGPSDVRGACGESFLVLSQQAQEGGLPLPISQMCTLTLRGLSPGTSTPPVSPFCRPP